MIIDIKSAAKAQGVTLVALADRLGVSRQTVHYYIEQADKNSIAQLERIAEAIGCKITDFFVSTDSHNDSTFRCPHCGGVIKIEKGE